MEEWVRAADGQAAAKTYSDLAGQVFESFNRRFRYEEGGYLYDVVDGEEGDDPAFRPNRLSPFPSPIPCSTKAGGNRCSTKPGKNS